MSRSRGGQTVRSTRSGHRREHEERRREARLEKISLTAAGRIPAILVTHFPDGIPLVGNPLVVLAHHWALGAVCDGKLCEDFRTSKAELPGLKERILKHALGIALERGTVIIIDRDGVRYYKAARL